MIFSLLPLAVIALIIFGVRRARTGESQMPAGHQTRLFFLYLILLIAVLVASAGLAGSLGPIFDRAEFVADDPNQTALNLAMLILGLPLSAVLGASARRRLAADSTETESLGWSLFVTVGIVVPLIVTMTGAHRVILSLLGAEDYDGNALSQCVVWGTTWFSVRRINQKVSTSPRTSLCTLVPALVGSGVAAAALAQLVAGVVDRLIDASSSAMVVADTTSIERGLSLLVLGTGVWVLEWLRGLSRERDSDAWRFLVVLFGVAGASVVALVSFAASVYLALVWWFGAPGSDSAISHFDSLPQWLGGAVAGSLVWAYHRSLLRQQPDAPRTEMDRVYEHVMSAAGLLSTAAGAVTLMAALIEAATDTDILRGGASSNTLLLAATLLAVGIPVWLVHWRSTIQRDEARERLTATRRLYLFALLGIGGLVGLGTAIATVYLFLRDIIEGRLEGATLRAARYPLAILATCGAVGTYHLVVYRNEHSASPPVVKRRRILVAGPRDDELQSALASMSGLDVEWIMDGHGSWPTEEVKERVSRSSDDMVLVLSESGLVTRRL